jgi:Uma2 family endonuclease
MPHWAAAVQASVPARIASSAWIDDNGFMPAIAQEKRPLTRHELAERWDQIVEQFEQVDLNGWLVETNQYGEILMSPPPEGVHQARGVIIVQLLDSYFPGYQVLYEKPVVTDLGVKNPDVVLIVPDQIEQAQGAQALSSAPPICVEILSPSNTEPEIAQKRDAYLRAGAQEVWVCDRDNRITFFNGAGELERSELCAEFPLKLDLSQSVVSRLQERLGRRDQLILHTYDQLVKTPEDRNRLEKENPELVVARDEIVATQKRALLVKEQETPTRPRKRTPGAGA